MPLQPLRVLPRPAHGVQDGRTSIAASTLNMVNCILGAGVLGYPYCFKSCGILLTTLIVVASIVAVRFSYSLLLYCMQISNKRTYEELAEQAVGRVGRQLVELCTAAINLGCIVAYLNILADVLSSVAGTIIPPGAEPSRGVYITGEAAWAHAARLAAPRRAMQHGRLLAHAGVLTRCGAAARVCVRAVAGVTVLGALPVALLVRDHAVVAASSTASVGFIALFAVVVTAFATTAGLSTGE